jgi:hypothetical protein
VRRLFRTLGDSRAPRMKIEPRTGSRSKRKSLKR